MNPFDLTIVHFLNSFSQRSAVFDSILVATSENVLLQGGLVVVLFWWAWTPANKKGSKDKDRLIFGMIASIFAVFVARILAWVLPFRLRPIHNPLVGFRPPISMNVDSLIGWSSFPSDHATVFFCLAICLWFVSRRLGAVALVYSLLGVCFPRIYVGIHYPTDVLAGAALGIGIAYLGKIEWIQKKATHPFVYWQEHYPASFTAFLFFVSFEVAEEFDSVRRIGLLGFQGIEGLKRYL